MALVPAFLAALGVPPSFADVSPRDLLIRVKNPQKGPFQEFTSLNAMVGPVEAAVVNRSEGLLKLHFTSPMAAESARKRLEQDGGILSVTQNALYRPALSYRFKTIRGANDFFAVSRFVDSAPIPAVLEPPTKILPGPDPLLAKDWAMSRIHFPGDLSFPRSPVTVAVIDTGVDYNHEDLSGAMWRSPLNSLEVGYDFVHENARPFDVVHFDLQGCIKDFACQMGIQTEKFLTNPGHGTHCAGHVGAVANNSTGILGVGAGAHVMGLKFFADFGDPNQGQGDDAAAIRAIDFAIQNGVKVISASWGGRMARTDAEKSELKQALLRAQRAGAIFIVAAGNDALDQDADAKPDFPAAYDLDNLIVVAASDSKDQLAPFSNFGARTVHIATPGVKILSTTVGSHYDDIVGVAKTSDGHTVELDWDGTSMATPIVAGAVALVWSKYPNADYHQIRERILKNARKVAALNGKVTTGGVLDLAAALAD